MQIRHWERNSALLNRSNCSSLPRSIFPFYFVVIFSSDRRGSFSPYFVLRVLSHIRIRGNPPIHYTYNCWDIIPVNTALLKNRFCPVWCEIKSLHAVEVNHLMFISKPWKRSIFRSIIFLSLVIIAHLCMNLFNFLDEYSKPQRRLYSLNYDNYTQKAKFFFPVFFLFYIIVFQLDQQN